MRNHSRQSLRRAFIVYLLSHDRPMHEVLAARRKDISEEFVRGFNGMTEKPITVKELADAREQLIAEIVGKMPDTHRPLSKATLKTLLGLPTVPSCRP